LALGAAQYGAAYRPFATERGCWDFCQARGLPHERFTTMPLLPANMPPFNAAQDVDEEDAP
jgi:hypothetical protein